MPSTGCPPGEQQGFEMAHGKKYRDATKRFDRDHEHSPEEAVELVRSLARASFDETVELVLRLGVDPRKADQMVRGTVALPSVPARTCIAVFARTSATRCIRPVPTSWSAEDLAEQVEAGSMDFDLAICDPRDDAAGGQAGPRAGPPGSDAQPEDRNRHARSGQGRG